MNYWIRELRLYTKGERTRRYSADSSSRKRMKISVYRRIRRNNTGVGAQPVSECCSPEVDIIRAIRRRHVRPHRKGDCERLSVERFGLVLEELFKCSAVDFGRLLKVLDDEGFVDCMCVLLDTTGPVYRRRDPCIVNQVSRIRHRLEPCHR